MILKGLGDYEAVVSGGKWIISLPPGNYKINGVEVAVGYNDQKICDKDSTVVQVTKKTLVVKHYKDREGNIRSREEFTNAYALRDLYEDEDGFTNYQDLEKVFKVRAETEWLCGLTSVYEDQEYIEKEVGINVVGCWKDTGSPFITTPYQTGSAYFSQDSVFKVNTSGVAAKALKDFCSKNDLTADTPTHSHLRFVKINGKFVFTCMEHRSFITNSNSSILFQNLEDARRYEAKIYSGIYSHLSTMFSCESLSDKVIGELYEDLLTLSNSVNKLKVKQCSSPGKVCVRKRVNKLLDTLKEEARKND